MSSPSLATLWRSDFSADPGEQWKETNDPYEAVVHGLSSTARVITSAAMIMVSVFLAFVVNGDPTVKQFGLGMAVAVDATVVRCVLVPAIINPAGPVPAKGERESTAAGAPCV